MALLLSQQVRGGGAGNRPFVKRSTEWSFSSNGDDPAEGGVRRTPTLAEAPGIEPPPPSQSCEITTGRESVDDSNGAQVPGTPSTENARAIPVCELSGHFETVTTDELTDAAAVLVRVGSYAIARVLLDELERRQVAERANVVRLDRAKR